eukprot:COSAG05_NODE_1660_length_4322_cov_319.432394_5_plen_61_part_00
MMAITGSVAVSFRIVVACRDAKIYTIKGQVPRTPTCSAPLPLPCISLIYPHALPIYAFSA